MRKAIRFTFFLTFTSCIALLLYFRLGAAESFGEFEHFSVAAAAATLCLVYISLPIRTVQWKLLLRGTSSTPLSTYFRSLCFGHLGNLILPARGGELVRAYTLAQSSEHTFSRILPSVLFTRLHDLMPILLMLLVSMGLIVPTDSNPSIAGTGSEISTTLELVSSLNVLSRLLLTICVSGVLLAIAYFFRYKVLTLSKWAVNRLAPRFKGRIEHVLEEVVGELSVIGNTRAFWGAQMLAFVCWAIFAVAPIPLLLSFGFSIEESFRIGIAQTAFTSLTFVLPSTPGAVGTFHVLCLASIYACVPNVDPSVALSYTVIAHLIGTAGPALPGLVLLPFNLGTLLPVFREAKKVAVTPSAMTGSESQDPE